MNTTVKCIMISQVSAKELISKAYSAGIDFFISKPINLIEVRSVLKNVEQQITNEHTLANIRRMFMNEIDHMPKGTKPESDDYGRKLKYILNRVGMSGEKGCPDIIKICEYLRESYSSLQPECCPDVCEAVSDSSEIWSSAAINHRGRNVQHCPYGDRGFYERDLHLYSGTLFSFEDVKAEMDYLRENASGEQGQHQKVHRRAMLEAER